MDADRRNDTGIFRYTDVEYTPEGHTDAYRWDDFLGIAGGHVYSAMDTIDMVSTGGQYEGDEPEHAYACEIVGCCGLSDGVALFRPVSHDGADLIQIAFLRNDVDDATGAYTERFEAGSFDLPAADLPRSEFGVDLLEYFSGRSFKYTPGVSRGLDPREAVDSIEDAIGCDLELFDGFWLGVPGEADMRVGPYTKKSLLDFSYYAKELSCRYGFADSDILEIARHLPDECPDCLAAVKAYLDCEYVPDGNAPDEKTYRWGDFLEIAGGDARYAAMLVDRTAAGEPEAGLHPETLVDQDIRDGEAFMLAGRPISVDINLPDGKGSGQLAFIEAAPAELQDDYPTPVHVFTYDGRDSEPVHRTDVHLDGDAMTLDPVKGTPAHNGAQAHDGDSRPADLAKAASAAANRTAGSHADEAGGIKH